jgi:hypothetical protein
VSISVCLTRCSYCNCVYIPFYHVVTICKEVLFIIMTFMNCNREASNFTHWCFTASGHHCKKLLEMEKGSLIVKAHQRLARNCSCIMCSETVDTKLRKLLVHVRCSESLV